MLAEKIKNVTISVGTGMSLTVDPSSLRIKQGETGTFTLSVNAPTAWNGSVTLNVEGVPSGATAIITPSTMSGSGVSALSITTNGATPTGIYPITVRAQGNDGSAMITQTFPVTLEVSGFSLQAAPANISISQQETAEFLVSAQSLNGYEGNITLSDATGGIGGLI